MPPELKKAAIFTDGACKGNPGPGGYGGIVKINGEVFEFKGGAKETTNNIMEMTAAIVALKKLEEPCEVELTTDSQYLVKGITQWLPNWAARGWTTASRQPVKNKALWKELEQLNQTHRISWIWTRGHSGHPENERADQLANEAVAELYQGRF
ncbi:MAG: ribonuclease HI [Nitrospinaceae bacterium]